MVTKRKKNTTRVFWANSKKHGSHRFPGWQHLEENFPTAFRSPDNDAHRWRLSGAHEFRFCCCCFRVNCTCSRISFTTPSNFKYSSTTSKNKKILPRFHPVYKLLYTDPHSSFENAISWIHHSSLCHPVSSTCLKAVSIDQRRKPSESVHPKRTGAALGAAAFLVSSLPERRHLFSRYRLIVFLRLFAYDIKLNQVLPIF